MAYYPVCSTVVYGYGSTGLHDYAPYLVQAVPEPKKYPCAYCGRLYERLEGHCESGCGAPLKQREVKPL